MRMIELFPDIIHLERVCPGNSGNAQAFPSPLSPFPLPALIPKPYSLRLQCLLCEGFSNSIM